jgi:NDP-sugar pyrophosphorylase family protein
VRPQWYGWVDADADGRVRRVSVKKPISDNPLADAVVSGTFWFRSAGDMMERIRELVRLDRRVNNEFYLDSVPELLIRDGQDVRLFEVDKYIGWGTPDDVEDYHRWHDYITRQASSRAAAA